MKDKTILSYYVQLKVVLLKQCTSNQKCTRSAPSPYDDAGPYAQQLKNALLGSVHLSLGFVKKKTKNKKTFISWRAALLETVKEYLVHTGKHFEGRGKQKTKTGGNGNYTMCVFLNLDCDKEYNDGLCGIASLSVFY